MHKLKRFPTFINVLNGKRSFSSIIFFVIFSWLMSSVIVQEPLQLNIVPLSKHESFSSKFKEIKLSSDQVQQLGLDADGTSALTEEQCFKLACFLGMSEKGLDVIRCEGGGSNEGVFILRSLNEALCKRFNQCSGGLVFKKLSPSRCLALRERIKIVAGPDGLGQVRIEGRASAPLARTLGIVSWGEYGCIEVMEEAPGEVLGKIYSDLPEDLSEAELQKLNQAFYATGSLLGKVHQVNMIHADQHPAFWRMLIFGDCHMRNVFFNYATGLATLIDGEGSAHSTYPNKPQTFLYDIILFIFHPLFFWKDAIKVSLTKKALSCANALLRGYVASFPRNRRAELGSYIKGALGSFFKVAQMLCCSRVGDYTIKMSELVFTKNLELAAPFVGIIERLWNGFVNGVYSKYKTSAVDRKFLLKNILSVSNALFEGVA